MRKNSKIDLIAVEKERQSKLALENEIARRSLMKEFAVRKWLGKAEFLLITSISLEQDGAYGLFKVTEDGVFFDELSDRVVLSSHDMTRRRLINASAPKLRFPCAPTDLIAFLQTPMALEHFRADDEFVHGLLGPAGSMAAPQAAGRGQSLLSNNAKKGAEAKKANSPQQAAKLKVHRQWLDWQEGRCIYPSAARFASAMVTLHPALKNTKVIERWATQWLKDLKERRRRK